nr:hypothetical protein [Paracoccus mutanolyticus]
MELTTSSVGLAVQALSLEKKKMTSDTGAATRTDRQAQRQEDEQRQRAARVPKGIRGLWGWFRARTQSSACRSGWKCKTRSSMPYSRP